MTPRHSYTGPTTYDTGHGPFEGPRVVNALILAVEVIDLTAQLPHSPAVHLIIANNTKRGPQHLDAVQWGTPDNWLPAPPAPANPVVAALTAAGLSAHPHTTRHGDAGAIIHLNRKGRYCQLVIIERGTAIFYQFRDRHGHEPAFYRWDNTRACDTPTSTRNFCRTFTARILPNRPADAVPGQPLNP
ncbi:hypothetical protein [Kitasatospora cineracea]|uniref:hypothetical protein n=1 Tax=Kitasatospora cineracea TaxID=88074 RepID=UPI0033FEAAD7